MSRPAIGGPLAAELCLEQQPLAAPLQPHHHQQQQQQQPPLRAHDTLHTSATNGSSHHHDAHHTPQPHSNTATDKLRSSAAAAQRHDDDGDDVYAHYRILDVATVVAYAEHTLSRWRALADGTRLAPGTLTHAEEVGDGNLNLVFRLCDADGRSRAVLKQALPYVRMVGESWPLTTDRNRLEATTLQVHATHCPATTERVLYTSVCMSATVVEDLSSCVVWRRALVQCRYHAHVPSALAAHLARVHFFTSDLAHESAAKKRAVRDVTNVALCKITEDLVFTDPYMQHERNRYEAAQEALVRRLLRDDAVLRWRVAQLKWRFMTHAEAHLHGDVHSGSVLVDDTQIKVIDAEFGFYGPMGFDLGNVLGSLLLNYVALPGLLAQQEQHHEAGAEAATVTAQEGHAEDTLHKTQNNSNNKENAHDEGNSVVKHDKHTTSAAGGGKVGTGDTQSSRQPHDEGGGGGNGEVVTRTSAALLLEGVRETWYVYARIFRELATTQTSDVAFALPSFVDALLQQCVWRDAVGYTGTELIRRTVGLAHVADLDSIVDEATRLSCKEAAVRLGRHLVLHAEQLHDVEALVRCVRDGDYLSA